MTALKNVLPLALILALSGCVMAPNKQGKLEFNGKEVVTQQQAKDLPRLQRLQRIVSDIEAVGFKKIKVSRIIDPVSKSILALYENQYKIVSEYKTLLDNHKDVMSFLMANQGKSEEELDAEISRFDANFEDQQDKIGPKVKAYRKATDKIWQENVVVGLKIAANTVNLANTLKNSSEEILGAEGLKTLLQGDKLIDVYNLSQVRLHLAKLANEFIEEEQAIIDISKQLQDKQNQKLNG